MNASDHSEQLSDVQDEKRNKRNYSVIVEIDIRDEESVVCACETRCQHQQQTKYFTALVDVQMIHLTQLVTVELSRQQLRCLSDTTITNMQCTCEACV